MSEPHEPEPRSDRRGLLIAAAGALIAVVVGTSVAMWLFRSDPGDDTPPPASEGGLKVELTQVDAAEIDPSRELRCFVDGKLVGELTLEQCARRNGVAAQALDVGTDASGALAAVVSAAPPVNTEPLGAGIVDGAPTPTVALTPPPPPSSVDPTGACVRHVGGEWRELGQAVALDTCVQLLFAGRCEEPGGAQYGRWNGQALRLVPGRVEIAPDGATFRMLARQDPQTCMIP
ncbi:MAG TPA: hypothetical protein VF699_04320 [Caulobacteraceae bacterium]|jgi:hypothetical protein